MTDHQKLIAEFGELGPAETAEVLDAALQRLGDHGRPAGEHLKRLHAQHEHNERMAWEEGLAWLNEADES